MMRESCASYSGTCHKLLVVNSNYSAHSSLTLDNDIPGLDGDLDPLGDLEQFLRVAVLVSALVHPCLDVLRCG